MYTSTDLVKLKQIMAESPEHEAVISGLLASHQEAVSAIVHEIRNPLTLIYSTLQLIEASHPEVHDFSCWDSLHGDVLYMTELLADLSAYHNGFTLRTERLDTGAFLRKLVLSFAASQSDSPVEFTSRIEPDLAPIQADPVKLRQVLLNLLKNACEAFPPGTTGSIRLNAENTALPENAQAPVLRICVSDNGCGIPADRLEEIFTPFVTHKPNGTGLGLPLSRRIIEAHGGSLQASSDPAAGTIFTILLPTDPSSYDTGSQPG